MICYFKYLINSALKSKCLFNIFINSVIVYISNLNIQNKSLSSLFYTVFVFISNLNIQNKLLSSLFYTVFVSSFINCLVNFIGSDCGH